MVTALYDLGRSQWSSFRRSFDVYLSNAIYVLSLDVPIVAFVEPKIVPFIQHFRKTKRHITRIIVSDLRDLEFSKEYYDVIAKVMDSEQFHQDNHILHHPEGFSPEYNVLMNAKMDFLKSAVDSNFFHSSHFFWIDMGYGHGGRDIFPENPCWEPANLIGDTDNITYIAVNDIDEVVDIHQLYKRRVGPGVNGAFFGGSAKAVQDYHDLYLSVLNVS